MDNLANNECYIVKMASIYIRDWIDNQNNVKEESLTDWLLYDISTKCENIIYKAFTRNEEAKVTGADWEWWFVFNKYSYRFRVQAKKLKSSSDNYASIAHTNQYGLQIEKLINDSNITNSLPIYAFYTDKVEKVKCKNNILYEGVYLSGANNIYQKIIIHGKKKIDSNIVLEETIPLSCMFCCPFSSQKIKGDSFDKFIIRYFDSELKNRITKEERIPGQYLMKDIPPYISSLIKQHEENIPDWWEEEFSRDLEGIKAILIFDGRDDYQETY